MATSRRVVMKGFGYDMLVTKTDTDRFEKIFDARESALRDFSDPLSKFGEFLIDTHIPYQFHAQGAPDPWAPLSPSYAVQKMARWGARPLLLASGTMYRGFSYRATKFTLKIKNITDYATHHQTGTRKMPARKWLQLGDNDLGYKALRSAMRRHVLGEFGVRE